MERSGPAHRAYFASQLRTLTGLLDSHHEAAGQGDDAAGRLLSLLDHLLACYGAYIDHDQLAPLRYQQRRIAELKTAGQRLRAGFDAPGGNVLLRGSLTTYLDHVFSPAVRTRYTYAELEYLKGLLNRLDQRPSLDDDHDGYLANILVALNYNKLDFILFLQGDIREKLSQKPKNRRKDYLRLLLRYYEGLKIQPLAYDPSMPAVAMFMNGWLKEELALLSHAAPKPARAEKIPVDLSVAHLAGLLKLFYEEGLYPCVNLTRLFCFFSDHFSTKRQTNISARSLSKEYYTIDQSTAAYLRDKLMRMLSRLNRQYFPAVLAAGVILGVC